MLGTLCVSVLLLSVLGGLGGCCDYIESICGAHAPGDILLGGLLPFHATVGTELRTQPNGFNCTQFDWMPFALQMATILSIEQINESGFLPGVKLGYIICDTCSDAIKALQGAQVLLSLNGSLDIHCNYSDYAPLVKAVVGGRYSEESIAIAKLLGLYMVPQISWTSSAAALSDKQRFPSFLRTIPSDVYQTRAMARLISHFGWDWVGVVSGDDDYAKAAMESFLRDADEQGVCVAYKEMMPHYLGDKNSERRILEVASTIRNFQAKVVVLILKGELVNELFQEMIRTNTSKIWIASDAWSLSRLVANMEGINQVGEIFGFTFTTGNIPGFSEYLQKLRPAPNTTNRFIEEYKELRFSCPPELRQYNQCLKNQPPTWCPIPQIPNLAMKSPKACEVVDPQVEDDDFLLKAIDLGVAYGSRQAVWALAHALHSLLRCNQTACPGPRNFPPWQLLQELKKVNFTLDDNQFYFNENGDTVDGYDLIFWSRQGLKRVFKVVGRYRVSQGTVEVNTDMLLWSTPDNKVPPSQCSEPCQPGMWKNVFNISCCYNCTKCLEGTYSDQKNMVECLKCPNGTWSLQGATECQPKVETFLSWTDAYTIALLVFAGLGLVTLAAMLVIFVTHWNTPTVKVAGGPLVYLMLASLAVNFCSIVLFIGRPVDHMCRARQPLYGISFSLCVSCILVKSFRTFLAFLFDLNVKLRMKKLYKPPVIILLLTGIQGLICTFWLIFDSPSVEMFTTNSTMTVLVQCSEGSNVGFGIMLSYTGLLAFICFLFAFKGRKTPHRYNETGYIIFSMLVYLFVWVCFIPVYVTKSQQRSAVQASAILASSYGVLCCHLLPKCYFILFKHRDNTSEAYLREVRKSVFSLDTTLSQVSVQHSAAASTDLDPDLNLDLDLDVDPDPNEFTLPPSHKLRRRRRSSW
ncbi:olfactory receptor CB1 [Amia ocellicauda]|uniref:olfactory receptor CB1 n=1 Tax=Amia ocellicauda TaxID=2972642 RepID=UPI003463C4BA